MNVLTGGETEGLAVDVHLLIALAVQPHLDPPRVFEPWRVVAEGRQVEVRTELGVRAFEKIQVEGRRDAFGIVVGGVQAIRVLLEIDPDQQRAAVPENTGDPAQEGGRIAAGEVADRRSREETDATGTAGNARIGQAEAPCIVRTHGRDVERRIILGQGLGALQEKIARDVDGGVLGEIGQGIQQRPDLDAGAAAELDQMRAGTDQPGDLVCPCSRMPISVRVG